MAERRAACHLPDQVHHRPKWQLVLDMLDELAAWELAPPVLVADAGYGEIGEFRGGLDVRQVSYVVQVKADTSAYPEQVRPTLAPYTGRGRRPQPCCRDKPSSVKHLASKPGSAPAWISSGGAARACNAPASCACGSARPGSPHAARPELPRLAPHVTLVAVAHGFLTLERLRRPETGRVGVTLWQLLEQLQVLLACWAGVCPLCQRPAPRWLCRRGRPRAPT
jgi:DDE superfamily endonuclease